MIASKLNKAKVSVIMSVYNGQEYLRESIDSLLNQTYRNLEIIIINDGSDDLSWDIMASYGNNKIVFINREDNLGLTKSLNQGLSLAKGDFIARQDVGDISLESRIKEQVDFLEHNKEVSLLGTGIEWFDYRRTLKSFVYSSNPDNVKSQLLSFFSPVPHSTLMMRKAVAEKLNGYNEYFVLSQDYDFLLRASEVFRISSLRRPLVKLRFDSNSLTHTGYEQLKYAIAALVCAHRRLRGYIDYSYSNEKEWQQFLEKVSAFIGERRLGQRFVARKYFNLVKFSLLHFDVPKCLEYLSYGLRTDKWGLFRKGIGLRVPDDIKELLV